jgi:hypothetical protein
MTFMRSLSGVGNAHTSNNNTAATCCSNCGQRFRVLNDWDVHHLEEQQQQQQQEQNGDNTTLMMCLETNSSSSSPFLTPPPPSAVSPLVWGPMMNSNLLNSSMFSNHHHHHTQRLLMDYMTICKFYGCRENVGVLTTLRYSLPACRVSPGFGDVDMLALAELWLHHTTTTTTTTPNHPLPNHNHHLTNGFHRSSTDPFPTSTAASNNFSLLQHVVRLDLSLASSKLGADVSSSSSSTTTTLAPSSAPIIYSSGKSSRHHGITSHGALALAKVLQQPHCALQQVLLPQNRIGPYGATALFCAAATNPTLHTLGMRRCRIGQRGALAFCQLILTPSLVSTTSPATTTTTTTTVATTTTTMKDIPPRCGLRNVDLSANLIGFHGCHAIEQALLQRQAQRIKAKADAALNGTFTELPLSFITVNLEGNLVFQEVRVWLQVHLAICHYLFDPHTPLVSLPHTHSFFFLSLSLSV